MVGVQDKYAVHGSCQHRADLVLLRRDREHHVQEVVGILQVVARIDEGLTDRELEGHGADDSHHDRHGMGVAAKAPVKVGQLLVQHGVVGDRLLEFGLLLGVRQLAVGSAVVPPAAPALPETTRCLATCCGSRSRAARM